MDVYRKYKTSISEFVNKPVGNVFLFWKGRVALYAILKAIGINPGDEIILSGFTCVVVPNAIIYMGAKPVYVDIDSETFNPGFRSVLDAITDKTKAIIVQNTFGLSVDVDKIAEIAREKGIYTIEDCTHGFAGTFDNNPNGSYCDAAFYSTQWNKTFSTGIGGFAVVNNIDLLAKIEIISEGLKKPSFKDEISLIALNIAYKVLVRPEIYCTIRDFYRYLSRKGLVIGSSNTAELSSTAIPANYFKGASFFQAWLGRKKIRQLKSALNLRKETGMKYSKFLAKHDRNHVKEQYFSNHSFLKYPLLVKDREVFQKRALKARIPLGDWFVSPLHPIPDNFEKWLMNSVNVPTSLEISRHIINLPTECIKTEKVIDFLKSELDLIV